MNTKTKFTMIAGLSTLTAIGLIQVANLTISSYKFVDQTYFQWREIQAINEFRPAVIHKAKPVISDKPVVSGTIREITAYNAGDPSQTDSSPCDGAGGNICKALDQGVKVCAANFVPLGSKLNIQGYGVCTVLDRMNKRFANRVDIAMKLSEHNRAVAFGRQNLLVQIVKK